MPGAELQAAWMETDDGEVEYLLKVFHQGQLREVEVDPDGEIGEQEAFDEGDLGPDQADGAAAHDEAV